MSNLFRQIVLWYLWRLAMKRLEKHARWKRVA